VLLYEATKLFQIANPLTIRPKFMNKNSTKGLTSVKKTTVL